MHATLPRDRKRFKYLSLAGVAKAGKDTFFRGLVNAYPEYKFQRESIADIIRHDLVKFIHQHTGIDVFRCTPEEKEQVRPLLAWYGDIKRKRAGALYFLEQIEKRVLAEQEKYASVNGKGPDFIVITDSRFKEFQYDEPEWIHDRGGKIIHIERVLPDGRIAQPANELERINDPRIKAKSDLQVKWNTLIPTITLDEEIAQEIKNLDVLRRLGL